MEVESCDTKVGFYLNYSHILLAFWGVVHLTSTMYIPLFYYHIYRSKHGFITTALQLKVWNLKTKEEQERVLHTLSKEFLG